MDPQSGTLTRLFHPRLDNWNEHFRWAGPLIVGLTPVGTVTVMVLAMNHPHQIAMRQSLMAEGVFWLP